MITMVMVVVVGKQLEAEEMVLVGMEIYMEEVMKVIVKVDSHKHKEGEVMVLVEVQLMVLVLVEMEAAETCIGPVEVVNSMVGVVIHNSKVAVLMELEEGETCIGTEEEGVTSTVAVVVIYHNMVVLIE